VSGCCYIGVDGDLGDSGISNFEVALRGEPFDDIESNGSGELLGGEPESFGLPFGWFWKVFEFHPGNIVYRDSPDLLSLPILPSSFFFLLEFDLGAVVGIGYLSLSNAALRHIRLDRFASSANGSPLTSVRGSIPYRSTIH